MSPHVMGLTRKCGHSFGSGIVYMVSSERRLLSESSMSDRGVTHQVRGGSSGKPQRYKAPKTRGEWPADCGVREPH